MKFLMLALFAVAALAFAPVSVAEVSNLDSYQEFLPASSSGGDVSQSDVHDYNIGLSGPNFCMTKTIQAQSESEALNIARQSCEKCRIENLTGQMYFGEAPWEITPKAETFCQLDLK